MPLTYDLTDIANHRTVCWSGDSDDAEMDPITKSLIFATMALGIGEITHANAAEFYARLHLYESAFGVFVYKDAKDYYITPADVHAHIGLKTNATFQVEPRGKWLKRVFDTAVRDFTRTYQRELVKIEEAAI